MVNMTEIKYYPTIEIVLSVGDGIDACHMTREYFESWYNRKREIWPGSIARFGDLIVLRGE